MRREISELQRFYADPLGLAVQTMVGRQLAEAWQDARGLDVLGFGYATPFLEPFRAEARRVVAAMPERQGVEVWPTSDQGWTERNLTCLTPETRLPFPNAMFDRVLMVHALEEADEPQALLAEVRRVLAPSGRLIVVTASRTGVWSLAEDTPFGHGRPFTRSQLEGAVREAGLEPIAWSRALYAPPLRFFAPWAEAIEQIGSRLAPPLSGLVMLEAVKQTFAVKPRGAVAPAFARPAFRPVPSPVPLGATRRYEKRSYWTGRKISP